MNSNWRLGKGRGQSRAGAVRGPSGNGSRKPKVIAGLLVLGIFVFGGGSIYAATRPTWSPSAMTAVAMEHNRATARRVSPTRVTMVTQTDRTKHVAHASVSSPSITYTVKSGDTLSGIAQWFKLHGYGHLYAANMAVIGANPNLIFPGQRITIAGGKMSLRRPAPDGEGA